MYTYEQRMAAVKLYIKYYHKSAQKSQILLIVTSMQSSQMKNGSQI